MESRMSYGKKPKAPDVEAAEQWIAAGNGSARLKKIAEAGLVHTAMTVYREERLRAQLPELADDGWTFTRTAINELHNPSEAHVDALLMARAKFGGMVLAETEGEIALGFLRARDEGDAGPVLMVSWLGAKLVKPIAEGGAA